MSDPQKELILFFITNHKNYTAKKIKIKSKITSCRYRSIFANSKYVDLIQPRCLDCILMGIRDLKFNLDCSRKLIPRDRIVPNFKLLKHFQSFSFRLEPSYDITFIFWPTSLSMMTGFTQTVDSNPSELISFRRSILRFSSLLKVPVLKRNQSYCNLFK